VILMMAADYTARTYRPTRVDARTRPGPSTHRPPRDDGKLDRRHSVGTLQMAKDLLVSSRTTW
jgi:hypothetical protein